MNQKQNILIGALIGLAKSTTNVDAELTSIDFTVLEGLKGALPTAHLSDNELYALIEKATEEKRKLVPRCFTCVNQCGRTSNYDMDELWNDKEDIRALKSLLLYGICHTAVYAHPAAVKGTLDKNTMQFFYEALYALSVDDWSIDELNGYLMKLGKTNLACVKLFEEL